MKNNLCSSLWSGYDEAGMHLWRHERRFFFKKVMWSVVCSDQGSRLKAGSLGTMLRFGHVSKSWWAVTRSWNRDKNWEQSLCSHMFSNNNGLPVHLMHSILAFLNGFLESYIVFGGSSFVFHKMHLGLRYLFLRLGWRPTFMCFGGDFWGRSCTDHCRTASSSSVFHAPRLCWSLRNPGKTCPPRYVCFGGFCFGWFVCLFVLMWFAYVWSFGDSIICILILPVALQTWK